VLKTDGNLIDNWLSTAA